jgi:Putative Ig domain
MRTMILVLVFLSASALDSVGQIRVSDRFGRDLQARAIQLVDWEGYIANPAIPVQFDIPEEWRPATIEISGTNGRLQFADRQYPRSEPATVSESGPKLTLRVEPGKAIEPVLLTIWPDRDTQDEAHTLLIAVHTASSGFKSMRIPVLVEDQDRERPLDFEVTLDTSHDGTSFYTNPNVKSETQQAADDWAYFLSDNGLDEIRRGASRSWIWNADGFNSGYWVTNSEAFRGFLLYAWGMRNVALFSGGAASGQFQTQGGWPIDLVSGGHVAMEIRGNGNVLGWGFNSGDGNWWKSSNKRGELNDFYSIVHHEVGHALFFSSGHLKWDNLKALGGSTSVAVMAYLGGPAIIDRYDHIYDRANGLYIVDPASRRGAFGSEYAEGRGIMSPKQWILTKTDLLLAREIGYELRPTSPFEELQIAAEVTNAGQGGSFSAALVTGGVPSYLVEIAQGALPGGLILDSFTGEITGTPTASGMFTFDVQATDQLGAIRNATVTLTIATSLGTGPEELPVSVGLSNYPNPFSAQTLLSFELETGGAVTLEVVDLLGRRVEVLLSGALGPGSHEVTWDAASVPAGLYLARLSGPHLSETRALAVTR